MTKAADEAEGQVADASEEVAPVDLTPVREVLDALEFAGRENGDDCCPFCKAHRAIDPTNPRDWEKHAVDCKFAAARSLV